MNPELRDYQMSALRDVNAAGRRVLLQMPTGSGKTVTAVELIRLRVDRGPVWFMCHRREIVRQAEKAMRRAGIAYGVVAQGHRLDASATVQIAAIDTLRGRIDKLPPPATVVWDECQHIAARTWAALIERFSEASHIGLTATPERLDGKGLGKWFDSLVLGPSIHDLVDAGHLARYRIFAPTEPDLTEAKLSMGDYAASDLDRVMNRAVVIGNAVEHYNRILPGKRALVFCVSVEASKALVDRFTQAGIAAKHIDGTTPDDDRDAAISDLEAGALKVVSNVNVFTEGVDVPSIDGVILLRPTKSLALYLQMIGRALRPCDGKDVATILDHSGLVYEHGLPDAGYEWSLGGGARKVRLGVARKNGEVIRRCPECSCAHQIALTCPECGYEYPTGREIGECDGLLYEIRGSIPSGYVPISEFARQCGVSYQSAIVWLGRGIPSVGRYVHLQDGLAWVRAHSKRVPVSVAKSGSVENRAAFGSRYGISPVTVSKLIGLGLPSVSKWYVSVPEADAWIKMNYNFPQKAPDRCESKTKFSKRIGCCLRSINKLTKRGLIITENGFIDIRNGLEWVRDNTKIKIPPSAWDGIPDAAE